jgi:hypothetical protein
MSGLIAEVKVIGRGVVEVDRSLDEPQAKDSGVEVEIALRVAGDTGDMMNTGGPETHRPDSCLASFRRLALIRAGAGRAALTAVATLVLMMV